MVSRKGESIGAPAPWARARVTGARSGPLDRNGITRESYPGPYTSKAREARHPDSRLQRRGLARLRDRGSAEEGRRVPIARNPRGRRRLVRPDLGGRASSPRGGSRLFSRPPPAPGGGYGRDSSEAFPRRRTAS